MPPCFLIRSGLNFFIDKSLFEDDELGYIKHTEILNKAISECKALCVKNKYDGLSFNQAKNIFKGVDFKEFDDIIGNPYPMIYWGEIKEKMMNRVYNALGGAKEIKSILSFNVKDYDSSAKIVFKTIILNKSTQQESPYTIVVHINKESCSVKGVDV